MGNKQNRTTKLLVVWRRRIQIFKRKNDIKRNKRFRKKRNNAKLYTTTTRRQKNTRKTRPIWKQIKKNRRLCIRIWRQHQRRKHKLLIHGILQKRNPKLHNSRNGLKCQKRPRSKILGICNKRWKKNPEKTSYYTNK